jgi:3-isopropylmalate dehydrogenase
MLFDWLAVRNDASRFAEAAREIEGAVEAALNDPSGRTADLSGPLGTAAFGRRVASVVAGE